jgi:methionyl-tRNA formyltransferase
VSLCYFGTSEHAAVVLRAISRGPYKPALVITPVDRPKGRGRKLTPPPVAGAATELGIPLHQSEDINHDDTQRRIHEAGGHIGLVCAFGQLIGDDILGSIEILNIHPSLLPRWRGAAPIERALMAGDEETGVTIMRLVAELDAGPIAFQERLRIDPGEDFGSLDGRLSALGAKMALNALETHATDRLPWRAQPVEGVTYAEKIDRSERLLDPGRPADELARVVQALTPHIGAQLPLEGGERLGVRRARAVERGPAAGELEAGEDEDSLVLGCAAGALRIERVLPAGAREQSVAEYLRGRGLPALGAPEA